jgi:CheY-like chemotaxis protein
MATVLIVDDDPNIRGLLRLALEEEDYALLEACNGVDALEVLRATPQGMAVVLDHAMPKLDGCTLLERLAGTRPSSPATLPQHSFILCSAQNPESLVSRCRPLRSRLRIQFLPKPIDLRELRRVTKRAIRELERGGTGHTARATAGSTRSRKL